MPPANEDPPAAPEEGAEQQEPAAMEEDGGATAMDTAPEGGEQQPPPQQESAVADGKGEGGDGSGVGVAEAKGGRRAANGHAAEMVCVHVYTCKCVYNMCTVQFRWDSSICKPDDKQEVDGNGPAASKEGGSGGSSNNPEKHAAAAAEEDRGEIAFRLVQNDGRPENSERLVALKNIFAKQVRPSVDVLVCMGYSLVYDERLTRHMYMYN